MAARSVRRLRIFAGPNGSGKSTVIAAIRSALINGRPLDFGIYINADDIAAALEADTFDFSAYELQGLSLDRVIALAANTGLINIHFPLEAFRSSFALLQNGRVQLQDAKWCEHLAQVLATVVRELLLQTDCKFSFETVFSHESKLDFMRRARARGYKIYFYFIATESAEINIARIREVRVPMGGHDVPEEKIRARYERSLELMFAAAQLAYQAYFFDNSVDSPGHRVEPFAHFKLVQEQQHWDEIAVDKVPVWFHRYYLQKL